MPMKYTVADHHNRKCNVRNIYLFMISEKRFVIYRDAQRRNTVG